MIDPAVSDEQPRRRGPYRRGGEKGPNINPRKEPGRFATSLRARKEFIRVYSITGSVADGAAYVGVTVETVYNYRNTHPAFMTIMEKHRRRFRLQLEQAAHKRGVEGWLEPVYGKEARIGTVRRFSDRMLELLLKKNVPAFTDKLEVESHGTVANVSLEDLRKLSKVGREKLRGVLEELGGGSGDLAEPPEG